MTTDIDMKNLLEQSLLYDFYGELLTKHQKKIYEEFALNDLSLSEIAEEQGITRQGVHDLIKRCNKILNDYEDKLHLVQRFLNVKDKIEEINTLITTFKVTSDSDIETVRKIEEISKEMLDEL